ncbi:hypothetical protein [Rurimicrobium arvi]|uniref:Lipoprotein n=1 Tax=Rurimicrobium arvi TaxID=2049916 RepID=A0ABP8MUU0_9BACT
MVRFLRNIYQYAVLLLWAPAFVSCHKVQKTPAVSFYYWKTTAHFGREERSALTRNQVSRLYLRLFDIVWNQEKGFAIPDGLLQVQEPLPDSVTLVPVVFIRNEVFRNNPDSAQATHLAAQTSQLIHKMMERFGRHFAQVQFDCDWTAGSGKAYFTFLRAFRRINPSLQLSATIRLHQVKYPAQQGVPPVDTGVLMYYNMGRISNGPSLSVYDRDAALQYLPALSRYPLPLDLALPVFSWGILVRNDQVHALLNKTDERDYADTAYFLQEAPGRYLVKQAHFRKGFYLCRGDRVKLEQISAGMLEEMAGDVHRYYPKTPARIIFYDLDAFNLSRYDTSIFQEIAHRF